MNEVDVDVRTVHGKAVRNPEYKVQYLQKSKDPYTLNLNDA